MQIRCPSDCPYLTASREHPPAATARREQQEVGLLRQSTRDLNERQSQLFLVVSTFLHQYKSPEFQPLIDDDVAEAVAAVAGTLETASRGVIYEHRPAALPADRLATAIKRLIAEAEPSGGSAVERDAAFVLRRIEEVVRAVRAVDPSNRRAYLDLLGRLLPTPNERAQEEARNAEADGPRLIMP